MRRLLPAVALFEGVADVDVLATLSRDESAPGWLRGVSVDQWAEALDAAAGVGLLTELGMGMYQLHPALPAYLTVAWRSRDPAGYLAEVAAAQQGLIVAYAGLASWLREQIEQGDAGNALVIIDWQRRTLGTCLAAALAAQRYDEAQEILHPLTEYWDHRGLTQQALAWVDRCRARLEAADGTPPPLDGPPGALWLFVVGYSAGRQLFAGDSDVALTTYEAIRRTSKPNRRARSAAVA